MRVRIAGNFRETQERVRLEIDAKDVSTATAEAHSQGIEVSSVHVLENGEWAPRIKARGARKRVKRRWGRYLAVPFVALLSFLIPSIGVAVTAILLVPLCMIMIPASRGAARGILGARESTLLAFGFKAVVVLSLASLFSMASWSGVEARERIAEDKADISAANEEFSTMYEAAIDHLERGELEAAREQLVSAAVIPRAERIQVARDLLADIEFAQGPKRIRQRMLLIADSEFEAFVGSGVVPASMTFEQSALTNSVRNLAIPQFEEVAASRIELAAQRAEQAEKDRARAELAREEKKLAEEAAYKAERARYKAEQPLLKAAAERLWEDELEKRLRRERVDMLNEADAAWIAVCRFVKKRLKAPSTASFPTRGMDSVEAIGGRQYRANSYVDSENTFGANLRKKFTCTVEKVDGGWELVSILFE